MLLLKLFSKLPFWLLYTLSDVLAWLLYAVVRYRRQVVIDNLRHAFPEKTEDWQKKTARAFYRSFTDTWLETIKGFDLSAEQFRQRVSVENPEMLLGYEQQGVSTIGLTGHNSNWEWLLLRGSLDLKNVIAVYLKVNNPTFDKLMLKLRNRFNIRLVEKNELLRAVLSTRNQFKNIAMVADQAPTVHVPRHWQEFLNRPAPFFNSGEKLAIKEGMAIYYVGIKRTARGRYALWYEELGQSPYGHLPEGELTSRYVKALERNIRLQPEIYLWSHKRWKRSMPAGAVLYSAVPEK